MSERREVEVAFPLGRKPTHQELRDMMQQSYKKAKEIIGPGTVLGITSTAMGEAKGNGQAVFLVRLMVEAPEKLPVNGTPR